MVEIELARYVFAYFLTATPPQISNGPLLVRDALIHAVTHVESLFFPRVKCLLADARKIRAILRQKQKAKEMLKTYEINYSKRALIIFTAMTSILRSATLT